MLRSQWISIGYALTGFALSLFGIIAPAWIGEHAWIMWLIAGGAVLSFFMALRKTERFRFWLWKAFAFVLPPVKPLASAPENSLVPEQILKNKVLQLGRDLFAFAQEKGPGPKAPTLESGASLDDKVRWLASEEKRDHTSSVLHGYELRFKQRVRDMSNELREKGLKYEGIGELGAIRQVNSIDAVERIASACFNIVKEMDIEEARRSASPISKHQNPESD